MVLAPVPVAWGNHDVTTPQQPGLSGTEVLYILAKDGYVVIDPVTLKVLTKLEVGGCFSRLVPTGDGMLVYASNPCLNAVFVFDPSKHEVIDSLNVGDGPGVGMFLSPDWKTIWVRTINGVSVIDAEKRTFITNIPTGGGKSPWGPGAFCGMNFVPAADGRPTFLYVANPDDDTVTAIDVARRVAVATIPLGQKPQRTAYSALSGKVYVLNIDSKDISVIDPSTQQVVKTIRLEQKGLGAIAFTHDGRFATIDSRHKKGGGDSLVVISAETDSIVGTVPLHSSGTPTKYGNPSRLYFTPDDRYGFATHKTSPDLSVIDVANQKVVKLIKLVPFAKE